MREGHSPSSCFPKVSALGSSRGVSCRHWPYLGQVDAPDEPVQLLAYKARGGRGLSCQGSSVAEGEADVKSGGKGWSGRI